MFFFPRKYRKVVECGIICLHYKVSVIKRYLVSTSFFENVFPDFFYETGNSISWYHLLRRTLVHYNFCQQIDILFKPLQQFLKYVGKDKTSCF